jgi:hypothetical protein
MDNVAASSDDQVNKAEDSVKVQHELDKPSNDWANLSKDHKLYQFAQALAGDHGILKTAGYSEMYGVELVAPAEEYV